MFKYILETSERTLHLSSEAESLADALALWIDFMRGSSFIITDDMEEDLNHALGIEISAPKQRDAVALTPAEFDAKYPGGYRG